MSETEDLKSQLAQARHELFQFADAAGHDLKAPLRHVENFLQMVLEDPGEISAENLEHLEIVKTAAQKMKGYLDDLLSYSRSAKPLGETESVDVQALILDWQHAQEAQIREGQTEMDVAVLPKVRGCRSGVEVLIQEVLTNALVYTRVGVPAKIKVTAQPLGEQVVFTISDNGMGFDPKFNEEVFEPFRRLVSPKVPGSGLGLATARRWAEKMGGTLVVSGAPDEGTTVTLSLPAVPAS